MIGTVVDMLIRRSLMRRIVAVLAVAYVVSSFTTSSVAYEGHSYWAKDNVEYYRRKYDDKTYKQYESATFRRNKRSAKQVEVTDNTGWSFTPAWTVFGKPQNDSVDEYTISDAYVRPRIRTRDRTFVSHIDELHFTDD